MEEEQFMMDMKKIDGRFKQQVLEGTLRS